MDYVKPVMKKKKVRFHRILFIFFLYTHISYSYTLKELISLAEKNNPELIRIQKELSVINRKIKVAKKFFNPSISISMDGKKLFKEPLESGRIYIKQYIPYPEKLNIRKEIEKKRYKSEYYLLISKKENIFAKIYETGYYIWLIDQNLKIYNKIYKYVERYKNQCY